MTRAFQWFGALLLAAACLPASAQMCPFPGSGGCSSGPAVVARSIGPSEFAGNPVHLATGNKYQREADIESVEDGFPLELVRHYNSHVAYRGLFGHGWRASYEAAAQVSASGVQIVQADGRRLQFDRDPQAPARCTARRIEDGTVEQGERGIVWRWPDGQRLVFAASGRLERIEAPDGAVTSLDYDPGGRLLQVSSGTAARLSFDLVAAASGRGHLVSAVHAPAGTWRYRYDARDRLVEVVPPGGTDAVVREYRYEDDRSGGDPTNLTGIVLRQGALEQRVASYRYDARDRVIESDSAIAGETLRFDYDAGRETRVIDGMGRTSRYRFASIGGLERLVESRGPGCTSCPPTPMRWRWDANAQLVLEQRLDDGGRPVDARRLRRDAQQRVVEIDALRYADGAVLSDRWVERRRYGDAASTRPVRISEPSVVAGREHALEIEWTAQGRPASITEIGWIPDGAALAALAREAEREPARVALGAATGIELRRRLDMIESKVAGLWRVVRIEGPAQGEVRERRWDREGRLVAAIDPGGVSREILARDVMGRALRWRASDGVETTQAFDASGRIVETRVGGVGMRLTRDLLGRVASVEPDGGASYRVERDPLGHTTVVREASGATLRVERDAGGDPRRIEVRDASDRLIYGPMRLDRDAAGRLSSVGEDGHSPDLALGFGRDGVLAGVSDAIGRRVQVIQAGADRASIERRAAPGARAVVTSRWTTDPTHRVLLHRDVAGRPALRVDDDFGRTVLELHPDSGAVSSRHDIHDALVARLTSDGRSLAITRDVAGRPLAAGPAGGPEQVLWEWKGPRLMSVVDPAERRFYEYDAAARVTVERRELRSGQRWVRFERRIAYDAAGRAVCVELPDGHRLEHGYDAHGLLRSIRFDGVPVVDGIAWRPFGLGLDGGLGRMAHPGGGESVIDYDHHGRAIRFDEPAYHVAIDRDALGRVVGVDGAGIADRYRYDGAGRLVEARSIEGVQHWQYDALGRRLDSGASTVKTLPVSMATAPDSRTHLALEAGTIVAAWSPTDLVHYAYAQTGERTERWTPEGVTLFLQNGTQTLAEADASGHVRRHYIWIGQRPAAVVDVDASGASRLKVVSADFRAAPVRMTDAQGHVQWSARYGPFGAAQVDGRQQLDLRLPGQTFDSVSGLHHHLHRDYDPSLGRFVQADPAGWRGGVDGHAYVANDPVNSVDPTGLYESDVHFYLLYFLAITSGVSAKDARIIALASQYIDDNPLTAPVVLNQDGSVNAQESIATRATALKDYHFVLSDSVSGKVPTALYTRNYANPQSPQLSRLFSAVMTAESDKAASCEAGLQLFGEYLHAFADTFSHRSTGNYPYDSTFPFTDSKAIGHGIDGVNPDLTYNHWGLDLKVFDADPPIALLPLSTLWASNQARTTEMAREVMARMAQFSSPNAKVTPWAVLQPVIAQFVKVKGDEEDGRALMPAKIAVLNAALTALGYDDALVWSGTKSGQSSYDLAEAAANRSKLLSGLDPAKYPGTLLP